MDCKGMCRLCFDSDRLCHISKAIHISMGIQISVILRTVYLRDQVGMHLRQQVLPCLDWELDQKAVRKRRP